jgi:hypothetical protein
MSLNNRRYPGNGLSQPRRVLARLMIPLALGTIFSGFAVAQQQDGARSDRGHRRSIIIIRPSGTWPYPHPAPARRRQRVRVVLDAQGSDWGAVYLDGRLIYRAYNHNRQETIYINPGGYRLEITGVARADVWASGYIDIGRNDANLLVIRFSKTGGVQVVGDPYAWIPR